MEHIKPQNVGQFTPEHQHEDKDVNVRAVLGFGAFLFVTGVLIHVAMWGLFKGLDRWVESIDPAPNPMVAEQRKAGAGRVGDVQSAQGAEDVQKEMHAVVRTFPEPRLQPDEVRDMDLYRQVQERDLHSYGRIDAGGETVRIPIERAMEIIAERGLPNFGIAAGAKPAQGQALGQPGQSSGKLPAAADKTSKK